MEKANLCHQKRSRFTHYLLFFKSMKFPWKYKVPQGRYRVQHIFVNALKGVFLTTGSYMESFPSITSYKKYLARLANPPYRKNKIEMIHIDGFSEEA